MQQILNTLILLEETSSTNDKIAILKHELPKNHLLQKVIVYALDSRKTFNVKKFPVTIPRAFKNVTTDEIFEFLDYLNAQPGASSQDKARLFSLAARNEATWEVVKRICNQDLKCGCGVALVNKAMPGLVFDIPYCRCSTDKKISNIKFPAYVQEKADGMFCNCFVDTCANTVDFLSREGKPVLQLDRLRKIILNGLNSLTVTWNIQGELRVRDPQTGKLLSRQVGNGILNSCLYGKAEQSDADNVVFCAWNIVDINDFWNLHESAVDYSVIVDTIHLAISTIDSPYVTFIENEVVNSLEEAEKFYARIRRQGGEGAIVKDFRFKWKNHTSPLQIKMKNVSDADLIVVDWNLADEDSKYRGMMGAIVCESRCGKLRVKVGTGFTDEDRAKNWDDEIGNVAALEFESVSKSKTDKLHCLYLPRFVEMRRERTKRTADTLEDLLKR